VKGASQVGFTIITMTFSLIALFIPLLLMGGIVEAVPRIRGAGGDGSIDLRIRLADHDPHALRSFLGHGITARPLYMTAERSSTGWSTPTPGCCASSAAPKSTLASLIATIALS